VSENQWRSFPTGAKARPVENGLKARTARGSIGSTWWSRRFIDVLESLAIGGRLTRGRTYARKGQVISLDVAPGEVTASVQGSQARPYSVRIGFAPFTELVWAKAEIALSEQALPSAKLLAGEVPPELETIFAAAGAPLFPRAAEDLVQRCSCPDQVVPCKHLAATFYLLAEAFDADPFLILRWRGRDREQLLTRMRELRSDSDPTVDGSPQPGAMGPGVLGSGVLGPASGAALALAGLSVPAADPDRFWQPPPLPPRPAVLTAEPDLLLRQLPVPGAELGGAALLARLGPAYELFAEGSE
jgi:uncharacterized Zn finger protein